LGYVKGNVWVISHKANRLKGDFTPNELKTFCENALALDWVTSTSDDEDALRRQEAEWKRQKNEKQKPRWWALWGAPEIRSEITALQPQAIAVVFHFVQPVRAVRDGVGFGEFEGAGHGEREIGTESLRIQNVTFDH
jgi:hypothetical protein